MKRVLFVLAALLIGIGSVSAKKRKEVKNDLVGVWQQVSVTPYAKGQYRPILKIVSVTTPLSPCSSQCSL